MELRLKQRVHGAAGRAPRCAPFEYRQNGAFWCIWAAPRIGAGAARGGGASAPLSDCCADSAPQAGPLNGFPVLYPFSPVFPLSLLTSCLRAFVPPCLPPSHLILQAQGVFYAGSSHGVIL